MKNGLLDGETWRSVSRGKRMMASGKEGFITLKYNFMLS